MVCFRFQEGRNEEEAGRSPLSRCDHGRILNCFTFDGSSTRSRYTNRMNVSVCVRVCVCARSGPAALDEARVQADVSDVVSVEQPGEEALQAQAVAAVRTGAVLPLKHTHSGLLTHIHAVPAALTTLEVRHVSSVRKVVIITQSY